MVSGGTRPRHGETGFSVRCGQVLRLIIVGRMMAMNIQPRRSTHSPPSHHKSSLSKAIEFISLCGTLFFSPIWGVGGNEVNQGPPPGVNSPTNSDSFVMVSQLLYIRYLQMEKGKRKLDGKIGEKKRE